MAEFYIVGALVLGSSAIALLVGLRTLANAD
jgi:hypothetical protein